MSRLLCALLLCVLVFSTRCKKEEVITPDQNGDQVGGDAAAAAAAEEQAARLVVRAHDVARRAKTDEEFVRLFNAQLDRAATRAPVNGTGAGTPAYYANARDLLEETSADARDIARGVQRERDTFVLRGQQATAAQHPDCVAVGTATEWICTGTLVGPNTVVTAGHCFDIAARRGEALTRIFFGPDTSLPGIVVPVRRGVPHPSLVANGAKNDIGLLLIDSVSTSSPVGIARGSELDSSKSVREAGFGKTTLTGVFSGKRQFLDVPIASRDCAVPAPSLFSCNANLEFVAKPATTQPAGVCHGDSGGPAYVRSGAGWRIAGVTSRPAAGVTLPCGGAAIFVRLDRYEPWIRSVPGVVLHP